MSNRLSEIHLNIFEQNKFLCFLPALSIFRAEMQKQLIRNRQAKSLTQTRLNPRLRWTAFKRYSHLAPIEGSDCAWVRGYSHITSIVKLRSKATYMKNMRKLSYAKSPLRK